MTKGAKKALETVKVVGAIDGGANNRITCKCGNFELHVLYIGSYETSAYCPKCKRLWTVHAG